MPISVLLVNQQASKEISQITCPIRVITKLGVLGIQQGAPGSCLLGEKPKVVRGHPCTPGFRQTASIHHAV